MIVKLFLLILSVIYVQSASLNVVSDDVVLEAIREHKYLLILFAKKDCGQNCKFENSVIAMKDEFQDTFSDSRILKVENSQLTRLYNPVKKEPALVFLRNGLPLIYPDNDTDDAETIFNFFSENRDPIVKELDDTNFEHLTQASTGSTTGDWLVQFYDNSCIDCQRLNAIWETVGAKLKIRMNVARVNRATKGIQTAKRFKVESVPEFILIRQGKYYRYNLKKYDIESFTGFAQTWFKSLGAEKIKVPASPFEELVDNVVLKMKDLPRFRDLMFSYINDYPIPVFSVSFVLLVLLLKKLLRKSESAVPTSESDDKKKEKKTEENKEKKKNAKKD